MPKETTFAADALAIDVPTDAAPASSASDAPKAKPTDTWVVMHDSVSNWVKGCRVTIDSLFHKEHPTRNAAWERLVRLGAVRPESDPEAVVIPVAEPLPSPPPIMMGGREGHLTVPVPAPKQV